MSFTRADPVELDLDLGPTTHVPKNSDPKESDIKGYLIRHPLWMRKMIKEAADREGLSINQWTVRVLHEFAKRSALFDWRTSPVATDYKKEPVVIQAGNVTFGNPGPSPTFTQFHPGGVIAKNEPIVLIPEPGPRFIKPVKTMRPDREIPHNVFEVPTTLSDSSFVPPDSDIPDLS